MSPFFSVVVPTYNRARKLERTLASLIAQDDADWEAIVVDDASTDDTAETVARIGDPRVRYVRLEENGGINVAYNRGVEAARGTWVTKLDSDDQLLPGALAAMRAATGETGADWINGPGTYLHARRPTVVDPSRVGFMPFAEYLRKGRSMGDYMPLVRREVLLAYPLIESLRGGEGIRQMKLARDGRGPWLAPTPWMLVDDEGDDRMTLKARNLGNLARIFWRELRELGLTYLRHRPGMVPHVLARAVAYSALYAFARVRDAF